MRMWILAGAVLALGACSSGNQASNSATDNTMVSDTTMDANLTGGDANMMGGANMGGGNAMDANGSVGAATGNGAVDAHTRALMKKDLKTHDHDTNLANGI